MSLLKTPVSADDGGTVFPLVVRESAFNEKVSLQLLVSKRICSAHSYLAYAFFFLLFFFFLPCIRFLTLKYSYINPKGHFF